MPQVSRLVYDLHLDEHVHVKDSSAAQTVTLGDFEGVLAEKTLTLTPRLIFASVAEARAAAEHALRAWEISMGLMHALRHPPSFRFNAAELQPLEGEGNSPPTHVTARYREVKVSLTITKEFDTLPTAPSAFAATPTVESLWHRFQRALDEREPMQAMAYFVLTVLESHFDGRINIGKNLHVSRAVIDNIGRISSERGDHTSARKAAGDGTPLSSKEKVWLRKAAALVIHRLAEHEAGHKGPLVTLDDLPPLS